MTEPLPAVVVGGGVTGLVAARTLRRRAPHVPVVLFEASERLGGKVRTVPVEGAAFEAGADWFVTRNPAALDLCRELGLGDDLVEPSARGALVFSRGALRPVPPNVRGVPTSVLALARGGVVSPAGAARALADAALSGPLSGPDVSIGALVRRRFGRAVLERLVDPMVAAARAGRPDDLSLAAAAPELDAAARSSRSVARALRKAAATVDAPSFLGLRGGMETLVDALARDAAGVDVRTGARATEVVAAPGGYDVHVAGARPVRAAAVVVTVPAPAAVALVARLSPAAAGELRAIPYAGGAVVALVYPPGTRPHGVAGSGVLVPAVERRTLTACAWYSDKWPHARPPDGSLVVRCFVGRSADDRAVALDDDALATRAADDVAGLTGVTARPRATRVLRWIDALPEYRVGHLERVARAERALSGHPRVALAGAAYRGSGLPDCIAQGRAAAERVARALESYGRAGDTLDEPNRERTDS
ncbi:MAG TPA: protoporphyrinogen oxidase [Actinomycetota bacterium]|nr:protoporphyrinogen oxidase [Actinomycetota bacterium]